MSLLGSFLKGVRTRGPNLEDLRFRIEGFGFREESLRFSQDDPKSVFWLSFGSLIEESDDTKTKEAEKYLLLGGVIIRVIFHMALTTQFGFSNLPVNVDGFQTWYPHQRILPQYGWGVPSSTVECI